MRTDREFVLLGFLLASAAVAAQSLSVQFRQQTALDVCRHDGSTQRYPLAVRHLHQEIAITRKLGSFSFEESLATLEHLLATAR